MRAPGPRGVRLAVLAALALVGGTAATLLSSTGLLRGGGPRGSDRADAPRAVTAGPAAGDAAASRPSPPAEDGALAPLVPPRGDAVLVITARNADDGRPASGALVRITQPGPDREARTDAEGFSRVERLLPGHAILRLSSPGRRSAAIPLRLMDEEETRLEVVLHPEAEIAGRVVDEDGGAPVPGARVRIHLDALADDGPWRGLASESVWAITGPDGRFSAAAGVPGGEVRLAVSSVGFRDETLWTRVPADGSSPAEVEIRLLATGVIRGVVRSPDGTPQGHAQVFVWDAVDPGPQREWTRTAGEVLRPWGTSIGFGHTASDGSYRVRGVPRKALLGVSAQRFNTLFVGEPRTVIVPASGEAVLDLVLGEAGSVRLEWAGGPPATGALEFRLLARGGADEPHSLRLPPDPHRGARAPISVAAPPGTWGVSVALDGRELALDAEVTVRPGKESVVRVASPDERPGTGSQRVSGVVVDGEGRPVAGARVSATPAEEPPSPYAAGRIFRAIGTTQADGSFLGSLSAEEARQGAEVFLLASAPGPVDDVAGPLPLPVEGARIVLRAPGGVRGRVSVPPGPVTAAHLALLFRAGDSPAARGFRAEEPAFRRMTVLGDGSFLLEGLRAGPGELEIRTEAGSSGPIAVDIPHGGILDLGTVEMPPGRTIRCRVVDAAGAPVALAAVRVEGERALLPDARSGVDGRCILQGVGPPGTTLVAAAAGYFPARIEAPDSGEALFVLRRGGRVVGVARDAAGRPRSGWRVRARSRSGGGEGVGLVDLRGRFEIHLPPEPADLELLRPQVHSWRAFHAADFFVVGTAEVVVEESRTVAVEIRATR